ncbi:hypothetical protein F4819DRAFT_97954 [Hypoxylon fuscum]|nr:hypothetical protein F4819DRAFT_97954 [Hypoxylon fuscum]
MSSKVPRQTRPSAGMAIPFASPFPDMAHMQWRHWVATWSCNICIVKDLPLQKPGSSPNSLDSITQVRHTYMAHMPCSLTLEVAEFSAYVLNFAIYGLLVSCQILVRFCLLNRKWTVLHRVGTENYNKAEPIAISRVRWLSQRVDRGVDPGGSWLANEEAWRHSSSSSSIFKKHATGIRGWQ